MLRLLTLIAIALLSLPLPNAEAAEPTEGQPNIVFILADDLGWRDTSCYGSSFYQTPNIDRLAARGVRFTDAYVANPLCSPTRASILTGLYPCRVRITTPACHLKQVVLDPQIPERAAPTAKAITPGTRTRLLNEYHTLAESLKSAGYATGFFGKWHLGAEPYMPCNQGFDLNVGGGPYPGPPSYFSPYRIHTLPNGPTGEHITDRLTDDAIDFLQANKGRPFLLNFWHYSVHAPFQGKDPLVEKYRERIDPNNPQRNPMMGAMIESLDQSVGRVLDEIERLGIADRTIVIFTSDNGGNMYNFPGGESATNNSPLRGGKANIYEGGVRVPLLVDWPGVTAAGTTNDAVVSSIDYFPTILDMLGLDAPADLKFDGDSFVSVLKGETPNGDRPIFCHFPHYTPATGNLPCTSVRQGKWKLIRFYADGPDQKNRHELYDLSVDIGEANDLSADNPELVAQLDALIDGHLEATEALIPIANPAYNPALSQWLASGTTELTQDSAGLHIRSTGGDPHFFIACPRRVAVSNVRIRMKSNAEGEARVYWTTAASPNFHLAKSTSFQPIHDGRWHDYTVAIPENAPLTNFRLDPATAPGEIDIAGIRFITAREITGMYWFLGAGTDAPK